MPGSQQALSATQAAHAPQEVEAKSETLEHLTALTTRRALLEHTKKQSESLDELKAGHKAVKEMHQLQQMVKVKNDSDQALPITDEMRTLMEEAKKSGLQLPEYTNRELSRDERLDLFDRLRVTIDDVQTDNHMKVQMMTRVTNTLHEMYAMARKIMNTLSESARLFARNIDKK